MEGLDRSLIIHRLRVTGDGVHGDHEGRAWTATSTGGTRQGTCNHVYKHDALNRVTTLRTPPSRRFTPNLGFHPETSTKTILERGSTDTLSDASNEGNDAQGHHRCQPCYSLVWY
jgi:hypothetical protein